MDHAELIRRIRERFSAAVLEAVEHRGDLALRLHPATLVDVVAFLRDDLSYRFLENLCGVDYLGRDPRFEVVYHLTSLETGHRLCLKVGAAESNPRVPTLTGIFPTANYHEREAYDMFGIVFDGHPSLERILMPDDWEGHPQRKDVPLGYEEVAFTFNQEQIYAHKPFAKE